MGFFSDDESLSRKKEFERQQNNEQEQQEYHKQTTEALTGQATTLSLIRSDIDKLRSGADQTSKALGDLEQRQKAIQSLIAELSKSVSALKLEPLRAVLDTQMTFVY